ncbi:uncharacterized protein DEA37_0003609 [Paragonimus westermani]|uniref:G-protein coupled receptors family 1 profile domain-containing protein n=1 Tax=Paragonimus westermani TaxID=34504 RepID=A0A5J4N934_9TREM|nr:uncharacterized protein DEA37_0014664 [Paragonimus westermani]KAA3680899.1 uncharacterized protein DEA37_0003609 [Paragonimus westermani]
MGESAVNDSRPLIPFDNDDIYTDCSTFAPINVDITGYCQVLASSGLVSGIILLPTILFSLLFGVILVTIHCQSSRTYAGYKLYGIVQWSIHLCFVISVGLLYLFFCRGLPWLGFPGICIHVRSSHSCQTMHFLNSLAFSCMATFMFLSTLNRTLMIQFCGQTPPTASLTVVILAALFSVTFALPDLLVTNLWRLDGRLHCSTNATLPKLIILLAEIHRFFLVHGFLQCIFTFGLLVILGRRITQLENTTHHLHTASQSKDDVSQMVHEICEVLRNIRRQAEVTLQYSAIMSTIFLVKSLVRLNIGFELYFFRSRKRTTTRLLLYTLFSVDDIIDYAIILLSAYYYWIHYYHFPAVRSHFQSQQSQLDTPDTSIMPVNPNPLLLLERWAQLVLFTRKFDQDLHNQLLCLNSLITQVTARRVIHDRKIRNLQAF